MFPQSIFKLNDEKSIIISKSEVASIIISESGFVIMVMFNLMIKKKVN